MSSDAQRPEPKVSVDLVDALASDIEDQVANLEDVADNVIDQLERMNVAVAAVMGLVTSMRREAARVRAGTAS
jgi:hypothetical protein